MAAKRRNLCKRLLRDLERIDSDESIWAAPAHDDNLQKWTAMVYGPRGSRWESGTFVLKFEFPDDYPSSPPKVQFQTKMFHPNIYRDGNICLDILQSKWLPTYDPLGVLISLQSLLDDPNCDSPANTEAATLYTQNTKKYNELVDDCVRNSWVFEESWLKDLPFDPEKIEKPVETLETATAKKRRLGA